MSNEVIGFNIIIVSSGAFIPFTDLLKSFSGTYCIMNFVLNLKLYFAIF